MGETDGPVMTQKDTRSEAERSAERTQARKAAEKVLAKNTARVVAKAEKGLPISELPDGERALLSADMIRNGYGSGIALQEMNADGSDRLEVRRSDSDVFTISEITGTEKDQDGKLFYVCNTPGGDKQRVSVDQLLTAHGDKNAGAMFPDADQATLYKWYTKNDGSDSPLEPALIDRMDTVDNAEVSQEQLDLAKFISDQIDILQAEIKQAKAEKDIATLDQVTSLLRECQITTFETGVAGIFHKEAVLKKLKLHRQPQGADGLMTADEIDRHLAAMREPGGGYPEGISALANFLRANLPEGDPTADKRFNELATKINNGDALSVLREKDVATFPGLNELVFTDPDVTNSIVERLLNTSDLPPEARKNLELVKKGGMSLLAVLLLLPVGMVGAALEGVSLLGKLNSR